MSPTAPSQAATVLLKPDRDAQITDCVARGSTRGSVQPPTDRPATLARAPEEGGARAARFGAGCGAPLRQRRANTRDSPHRSSQPISVRGSKRPDDFESGRARTNSIAGDPAGLDR